MSEEALRAAFRARDAIFRRHGEFKTVVLWFEHDLYDQLQLLQILDFLAGENAPRASLSSKPGNIWPWKSRAR